MPPTMRRIILRTFKRRITNRLKGFFALLFIFVFSIIIANPFKVTNSKVKDFSKYKIQKSKFSRRAEGIGGSGFNPQVGLISMRGNQPPTPLPPPTSSPHTWKDGMGVVVLAF